MDTLLGDARYIAYVGVTEDLLRVEKLIRGSEILAEKFRISPVWHTPVPRQTVYGSAGREAVESGIEYISFATANVYADGVTHKVESLSWSASRWNLVWPRIASQAGNTINDPR